MEKKAANWWRKYEVRRVLLVYVENVEKKIISFRRNLTLFSARVRLANRVQCDRDLAITKSVKFPFPPSPSYCAMSVSMSQSLLSKAACTRFSFYLYTGVHFHLAQSTPPLLLEQFYRLNLICRCRAPYDEPLSITYTRTNILA